MKVSSFQWQSLKARVTLTTLAILLIGIWSLAVFVGLTMREDMERLLGEQQRATVGLVANSINSDFSDRVDALHRATLEVDEGLIGDPKALQRKLEQRPLLQVLFNVGVFITRIDGTAVAEFPLIGRVGLNYMDRDHVAAALTEGKTTVGKPTIGKRVRAASFAITVPILDSHGKVIGAISGANDLSKPNFLSDIDQSRYGQSGGYLIVDPKSRQFVIATANNRKLVMQPIPAVGVNTVLDRRLQSFDGTAVNKSSLGIEVLTSSARIPIAGWFVIATLPTEEAFVPIRKMLQRTLIASVVLTLLASALAWLALKRQLKPALEAIRTLKDLSESGEHPQPLTISSKDEIGDLIAAFNRLLSALASRDMSLSQSEKRFRHFFEKNSSVQLLIEPKSGVIDDANQAAISYYGYPKEQLIGMQISNINTLSPEKVADERMLALREARNYFLFEHRLASGDLRDVEVHSTPIESNGQSLLLSIVHDVTDRNLAQKQLEQSHLEQKAILNSNIAGIVKLKDRHFVWMNQSFAQMLGYSVDELVGQPTKLLYPDEQAHVAFASEAYPILQSNQRFRKEIQYRRKDGSVGWFDISGELISSDSSESIWSFLDITESKNAALEVERLAAEQKALLNNDLIGIVTTKERTIVWANPAFEHMMGFDTGELKGASTRKNYHSDEEYEAFGAAAYPVLSSGKVFRAQIEHVRKDGQHIWLDVSGEMLGNDSGQSMWGFIDITQRKQMEDAIALNEKRMELALAGGELAMWDWNIPSGSLIFNARWAEIQGFTLGEMAPRVESWETRVHPDDLATAKQALELHFSGATAIYESEHRVLHKDGHWVWVHGRGKVVERDGASNPIRALGTAVDISVRKQLENSLRESVNYLQTIIQAEPECIKTVDANGLLLQMNPAGLAMIEAASLDQVEGLPVVDLIASEFKEAFKRMHHDVIAGHTGKLVFEVVGLKGGRRWLETHAVPMQVRGQTVQLAVTRDISERKQLEDQIRQLAFQDALTNLPNRRLLMDRFSQAMSASKRSGRYASIMFLDLDNFKPLNDAQGHEVGDHLLIDVAGRLSQCVREIDTVARFGGDEFVVMLSDLNIDRSISASQAQAVAEKIRRSLAEPYKLKVSHNGLPETIVTHHCTASIGVTLFLDHQGSEDEILNWADAAMYKAKENGRNTICFHEDNVA